jgi:manganese/zinc/iron transport system substrate-binding protein
MYPAMTTPPRLTPCKRLFAAAFTGLFAALMLLGGPACEREAGPVPSSTPSAAQSLRVVATVGMVGDVTASIGGERVNVTTLMGEGIDPHMYKASPADVRLMTDADLLLYSGLHLEGRMEELIESLGKRAGSRRYGDQSYVVRVTESVPKESLRFPSEFEGHPDPHIWFDVRLWSVVAQRIGAALSIADPANAETYKANTAAYVNELARLDLFARESVSTIPQSSRIMVTAHDAFGYFGAAYGLEVLAIQGISTDSEASLKDINSLVDTLVARKVPAVFIESSVPRKTIDALIEGCAARGHRVVIGGELFSDAFGAPGTFEGTYIGMLVHNVTTITKALGGEVREWKPLTNATAQPEKAEGTP